MSGPKFDPAERARLAALEELAVENPELVAVLVVSGERRVVRLAAALKQCADELAEEIEARYPAERRAQYPSYQLKYERDMEVVNNARATLREAGLE